MPEKPDKERPGPDPERLKIKGDWEDAMRKAIEKKRPPEGWPKPDGGDTD
ncbi:MAG: hypothetical protein GY715_14705 [Planctomycetes bacterium]|nr:hypothetical protein [Planctomycetota bacterium]